MAQFKKLIVLILFILKIEKGVSNKETPFPFLPFFVHFKRNEKARQYLKISCANRKRDIRVANVANFLTHLFYCSKIEI